MVIYEFKVINEICLFFHLLIHQQIMRIMPYQFIICDALQQKGTLGPLLQVTGWVQIPFSQKYAAVFSSQEVQYRM